MATSGYPASPGTRTLPHNNKAKRRSRSRIPEAMTARTKRKRKASAAFSKAAPGNEPKDTVMQPKDTVVQENADNNAEEHNAEVKRR